jgi:hypothetical protein
MKKQFLIILMALSLSNIQTTKPMQQSFNVVWHTSQTVIGGGAGYMLGDILYSLTTGKLTLAEPAEKISENKSKVAQRLAFLVALALATYYAGSAGLQGLAHDFGIN